MRPVPCLCAGIVALFTLTGCGEDPPQAAKPAAPAPAPGSQAEAIRNLQAADAVGYDGKAIQRQVQKTVDKAAERDAALGKELNQGQEPASPPP